MERNDITCLALEGDFDDFNLPPFREKLEGHLEEGRPRLVLDLQKLTFLTSRVVAFLVQAKSAAEAKGGDVVLVDPSPFVVRVLTRLRLDERFRIFPTEDEATQHFTESESGN